MKKTTKESSTESERMAALAKSYLDMMEKQMTATLTHPKLVETMMAGFQAMQQATAQASTSAAAQSSAQTNAKSSPKSTAHEPAARHAAASPKPSDDALVRLERRVAFLERQLEQLRNELRSHADGKPAKSTKPAKRPAAAISAKPVHAKPAASMGVADGARSKARASHAQPSKKRKAVRPK